MRDTLEVVELGPGDRGLAEAAAVLLNRELGEGMYDAERLLHDAADVTAGVWLVGDSPLAGAAVGRLLVPADAGYYARFGPAAIELFRLGTVGSLEALAVEPGHRRQGIGARLISTRVRWMWRYGCRAIITISWRSGREGSSEGIFRRLGFSEGPTVERFYHDESVRDGWACPVCGGPCECAATLFTLRRY